MARTPNNSGFRPDAGLRPDSLVGINQRAPGSPLSHGQTHDPDDDRDPTRRRQELEPGSPLANLDQAITEFLSGGVALDPNDPGRLTPRRGPRDEDSQLRPPGDDDEPPLVRGDPEALGDRALRRCLDTDAASPVLRRGLLGV